MDQAILDATDPTEYDPLLSEPASATRREEEFRFQFLTGYFQSRPEAFLFGLLQADIAERLRLNPYWEFAGYTMTSTSHDHLWPAQLMLHAPQRAD